MKTVLFYAKDNEITRMARHVLDEYFEVYVYDTLQEYDYIISFLNAIIIPKRLLKKAKIAAINFHPAPPKYPGTGGYSYALYNGDKKFGVTCHHMDEYIDHGPIIAVDWFYIYANATIDSLLKRAHRRTLIQFVEIITLILHDAPLPKSSYTWRKNMDYKRSYMKVINKKLKLLKPEVFE